MLKPDDEEWTSLNWQRWVKMDMNIRGLMMFYEYGKKRGEVNMMGWNGMGWFGVREMEDGTRARS